MKRFIIPVICILSILVVLLYADKITDKIINFINPVNTFKITINDNYKKENYVFVSNTKEYTPYGKQDLLNIIYSVINSGEENFTFYCPKAYVNCLGDINNISKDANLLTHLNNFVHPFNSFTSINTTISDSGEVNLNVKYLYEDKEKDALNKEVDKLIKSLLTKDVKDDYDKIKVIHDYIIKKTKYDLKNNKDIKSYNAYGALFNHLATCNGYTDLMAIFLTKMGYDNIKIATTSEVNEKTEGHVWNAVKVGKEWLHLDLTWDDPVSNDGKDYLYHKYFLIDTKKLILADSNITSEEHNFDRSIYVELKEN